MTPGAYSPLAGGCALALLIAAVFYCATLIGRSTLRPSGPHGVVVAPVPTQDQGARPQLRLWTPDGAGRFPLLLALPGWDGAVFENHFLIEELASHGFAVLTLQYPAPPADDIRSAAARRLQELRQPMDFSTQAAASATVRRADELTRIRAEDALWALDRLTADRALTGRLDLQRVGIFGYSLGGSAAAQACWRDRRFRAAVNMDGWQFADAARSGVVQPYLIISDDTPILNAEQMLPLRAIALYTAMQNRADYQNTLRNFARHGGTYIRIAGAGHLNFTDSVLQPWSIFSSGAGPIAPSRGLRIVNAYVLAFFSRHLAGIDSALLSGNDRDMPEAQVQVWHATAAADPLFNARLALP